MGGRRTSAVAGLAVLALAACAHPASRRDPVAAGLAPATPRAEEGLASFYAKFHEGRLTASGVPYDGRALTCAHREWPFGTRLRVTDLDTGASVVCQVNDRGPFVKGRVVDLSAAAARRLGLQKRGLARVRVERVR